MWWITLWWGCTPAPEEAATGTKVQAPSCEAGEVLAEDGVCVPERCGVDPFGGVDADVFVLAGAAGDGTREAPYGTIAEALDGGAARVAVGAPGGGARYDEAIVLDHRRDGAAVVGRCPELVSVTGGGEAAAVSVDGSSTDTWTVAGLRVDTPEGWGVSVDNGVLSLGEVVVEAAAGVGLVVWAGALDVAGVEVRGTRPDAAGDYGQGIEVAGGALTGAGLTVSGATHYGLFVQDGAVVDLAELVVEDVAEGSAGTGVFVAGRAAVTVEGCVVRRTAWAGISVGEAIGGASGVFTGCVVEDTHTVGFYTFGPGTTARFEGEIHGVQPRRQDLAGVGASADGGATLTLSGFLHDNVGPGVGAVGTGTTVTLTDTRVVDNQLAGAFAMSGGTLVLDATEVSGTVPLDDFAGYGVAVEQGAHARLVGGRVSGNAGIGLYVGGAADGPATMEVDGTVVEGTLPAPSAMGFGAQVSEGGALSATGADFVDNHQGGVIASGLATVDLVDVRVEATHKDLGSDFEVAVGLGCQFGATVTVEGGAVGNTEGAGVVVVSGCSARLDGVVVESNRYAGIVIGSGTLVVTGGTVSGTVADPGKGGGFAVVGQRDVEVPSLHLDGVRLVDNEAGGVVLLDDGDWWIEGGELAGATPREEGPVHLFGQALLAFGVSPTGLVVDGVAIVDAGGTAVLLDGGGATLSGLSWDRVGTTFPDDPALVQQGCAEDTPRVDPGDAPSARVCVPPDVVTGAVSRFVGEFAEAEALGL